MKNPPPPPPRPTKAYSEKEALVQRLFKEDHIDIKEVLILLKDNNPNKDTWITYGDPNSGFPYNGGGNYTTAVDPYK